MGKFRRLPFLILLLWMSKGIGFPQQPAIKVLPAGLNIQLDGKPDEPEWGGAIRVPLSQQSPHPGAPTPYKTEVMVLESGDAIYFGFRCTDPNPNKIAVHTMRRDGDLSGDDTVSIVLDTFGDHRTGYYFQINSVGTRVDGLI